MVVYRLNPRLCWTRGKVRRVSSPTDARGPSRRKAKEFGEQERAQKRRRRLSRGNRSARVLNVDDRLFRRIKEITPRPKLRRPHCRDPHSIQEPVGRVAQLSFPQMCDSCQCSPFVPHQYRVTAPTRRPRRRPRRRHPPAPPLLPRRGRQTRLRLPRRRRRRPGRLGRCGGVGVKGVRIGKEKPGGNWNAQLGIVDLLAACGGNREGGGQFPVKSTRWKEHATPRTGPPSALDDVGLVEVGQLARHVFVLLLVLVVSLGGGSLLWLALLFVTLAPVGG
jgi:hypothetical protein